MELVSVVLSDGTGRLEYVIAIGALGCRIIFHMVGGSCCASVRAGVWFCSVIVVSVLVFIIEKV